MKSIKVDKKTQKSFEEFKKLKEQTDRETHILISLLEDKRRDVERDYEYIWRKAEEKYKLNPELNYIYNSMTKEITVKEEKPLIIPPDDKKALEELEDTIARLARLEVIADYMKRKTEKETKHDNKKI